MTPKKSRGLFTYLIIIILARGCLYYVSNKVVQDNDKTEYATVINYFDDYKVCYYELDLGTGELTYQLKGENSKHTYTVPSVQIFYDDTQDYRKEYNERNNKE